jgi:hypothetical protein
MSKLIKFEETKTYLDQLKEELSKISLTDDAQQLIQAKQLVLTAETNYKEKYLKPNKRKDDLYTAGLNIFNAVETGISVIIDDNFNKYKQDSEALKTIFNWQRPSRQDGSPQGYSFYDETKNDDAWVRLRKTQKLVPSYKGWTPLHLACHTQFKEGIRKLVLIEQVDLNAKDQIGRTPLVLLCLNQALDLECLRILLGMDMDDEIHYNIRRKIDVNIKFGEAQRDAKYFLSKNKKALDLLKQLEDWKIENPSLSGGRRKKRTIRKKTKRSKKTKRRR